jgi:hypothetical protein
VEAVSDERIAALEARIASLETELVRYVQPSLKRHGRCTCGGAIVLRVPELVVANGARLVLQHGMLFSDGQVEAFLCHACGRMELYGNYEGDPRDLPNVELYAAPAKPTPPGDPYR